MLCFASETAFCLPVCLECCLIFPVNFAISVWICSLHCLFVSQSKSQAILQHVSYVELGQNKIDNELTTFSRLAI